jgi:hypothetical protein
MEDRDFGTDTNWSGRARAQSPEPRDEGVNGHDLSKGYFHPFHALESS